ncbi:hypothetical protein CONCODRAFT_80215 [Conidiobolus coronatus NRRL 28638]|uniref:Uncharacterized protein n=1 Tax=Conidiobolus coronatus (strain ATCC 28846 / CBS 209.66 / NRRL 28638) TaxID=796925 RepID=A0A137NXF4_CONC2|nr:hypothetical protein CONCODRAFT_80215 [Conidiobolus coronatus NRRL 28638]|eukprot:KXN67329.1 hypothetical protein CONCODRAFT_80215 [Conidiobolus coronatus NRRL 28638]
MSNIIKFGKVIRVGGLTARQNIGYCKPIISNFSICNNYLASNSKLLSLNSNFYLNSLEKRFYSSTKDTSTPPPPQNDKASSLGKSLNFKEIVQNLKKSPSSHLISFLILHELTAFLPVLIIFLILNQIDYEVNIDSEYLEQGKKYANYFIKKLGLEESENVLKYTLNLTAAYAMVKLALPIRLAACVALTPAFANRVIQPIVSRVKNIKN